MTLSTTPFRAGLSSGSSAFYLQNDYLQKTTQEFAQEELLDPVTYSYTSPKEQPLLSRIGQVFRRIADFFRSIWLAVHQWIGRRVVPASRPDYSHYLPDYARLYRREIHLNGPWKFKRLTIEVDGHKVDAMIVGRPFTLQNGRWVLVSNGSAECYEEKVFDKGQLMHLLTAFHGNALLFNYPGVVASQGPITRKTLCTTYGAMLSFLEDIGARAIVGYGTSWLGCAVQAESLLSYPFKEGVGYVFIKQGAASCFFDLFSESYGKVAGGLVKLFGWDFPTLCASKQLQKPEIILQAGRVPSARQLASAAELLEADGEIPAKATFAFAAFKNSLNQSQAKRFLAIPEKNDQPLSMATLTTLFWQVEQLLSL